MGGHAKARAGEADDVSVVEALGGVLMGRIEIGDFDDEGTAGFEPAAEVAENGDGIGLVLEDVEHGDGVEGGGGENGLEQAAGFDGDFVATTGISSVGTIGLETLGAIAVGAEFGEELTGAAARIKDMATDGEVAVEVGDAAGREATGAKDGAGTRVARALVAGAVFDGVEGFELIDGGKGIVPVEAALEAGNGA